MENEQRNLEPTFNNLFLMVGEIRGEMKEVNKKLDHVSENHDNRINCLEDDVSKMKGQAGVIGGIAGIIVSAVLAFIKGNN